MSNILFLGGGRRVELLKRFASHNHKIFSYELNENQPISVYAKIIKGLSWSDPLVVDDIFSVIKHNKIDLVIPLQDAAVLVATKLPIDLKYPVWVLTPSYYTAEICLDKLLFSNYMQIFWQKYYPTPLDQERDFISKPRFGYGSKGIEIISAERNDLKYLPWYIAETDILQQCIHGVEYSVDTYFDISNRFVDGVPRIRSRIAGGEVITSKTIEYPELLEISKDIGEHLRLLGPVNFQYIVESSTNKPFLLEINCRFGGGMTLSIEAGLDIISLIERDFLHKDFNYIPNQWKRNLLMERSYRDHFYENSI